MRQPPGDRHQPQRHGLKRYENGGSRAEENQRDPAVVGQQRGDRDQRGQHQRGADHVAPPRPAAAGRDRVAEQRGHRNVVRAAERPQRECQRRHQPIAERQCEFSRLQRRRDRQRQDLAEGRRNSERQRRAEHQTDHRADRGQHDHLRQIDREHPAAGRAQRLERGDHVALAIDVAFDRVSDADPADQQRGQADQRQKLGEALDIALELRRGVGAAPDLPAGVRQLLAGRGDHRLGGAVAAVRQLQPVVPAHQAARHQQAGGAQGRLADDDARAEADAACELVGLALDDGSRLSMVAWPIVSRAPGLRSSRVSSVESTAAPNAPSRCASARSSGMSGSSAIFAVDRIEPVHRLELDQHPGAAGGGRHRAHVGAGRDLAAAFEEAPLGGVGLAVDQHEREIAAEDHLAFAVDAVGEASRERADAGNRHHAERDAGDEDAEAVQAAAQFQQREAQRVERRGDRRRGKIDVCQISCARLRRETRQEQMDRQEQDQRQARPSGRRARRRDAPRSARRCRSGPTRS